MAIARGSDGELLVTSSMSRTHFVLRIEQDGECFVELCSKASMECCKLHDMRRACRSRFRGQWITLCEADRSRRGVSTQYELARYMIVTRLSMLISNRMFFACKKYDRAELPVAPGSMSSRFLGCTVSALVEKLEGRMTEGMDWNNRSPTGWHIDHIVPLAAFDLRKISHVRKACHHSNLRPCWASENLKKSDIIPADARIEHRLPKRTRKTRFATT